MSVDEEYFKEHQNGLREMMNNLQEFKICQKGSTEKSEMQNWIDMVDFTYSHPMIIEEISTFPFEELSAYYLSQKVMESIVDEEGQVEPISTEGEHYRFFSEILKLLQESEEDLQVNNLKEYLEKQRVTLDLDKHNVMQLKGSYLTLKGFIPSIPEVDWRKPLLKEQGLTLLVENLYNRETKEEKEKRKQWFSMAAVLEHIANNVKKRAGLLDLTLEYLNDNLPLEELQNSIAATGKHFGEKRHPSFWLGSMFMLPQVLETPLEDLLASSIVSKMANKLRNGILAEDKDIDIELKHAEEIIAQALVGIREIINKHQKDLLNPDMHFFQECSSYLKQQGFDNVTVFKWMVEVIDLVTIYESAQQQLEYRSTAKFRHEARNLKAIKGLVVGDSSVVGIEAGENIWVDRVPSLLGEDYPIKLTNASVAGKRTEDGVSDLPKLLRCFPDARFIIFILEGNTVMTMMESELPVVSGHMHRMFEIAKAHGISPKNFVWGTGLPENLPNVAPPLRAEFAQCVKDFSIKTGATIAELPSHLLKAENNYMSYDNMHFGPTAQEEIAIFACEPIKQIIGLESRKPFSLPESALENARGMASQMSLTPSYSHRKTQSAGSPLLLNRELIVGAGAGVKKR